jgi:hypothetical protein
VVAHSTVSVCHLLRGCVGLTLATCDVEHVHSIPTSNEQHINSFSILCTPLFRSRTRPTSRLPGDRLNDCLNVIVIGRRDHSDGFRCTPHGQKQQIGSDGSYTDRVRRHQYSSDLCALTSANETKNIFVIEKSPARSRTLLSSLSMS